ncbi:hypothetical protein [Methylocaldum marinum]|nr:hypothetical protein [Methylocaldum marinum]
MKEQESFISYQNPFIRSLSGLLKNERWIMVLFSILFLADWWLGWLI